MMHWHSGSLFLATPEDIKEAESQLVKKLLYY
jgi:hypothetical protein